MEHPIHHVCLVRLLTTQPSLRGRKNTSRSIDIYSVANTGYALQVPKFSLYFEMQHVPFTPLYISGIDVFTTPCKETANMICVGIAMMLLRIATHFFKFRLYILFIYTDVTKNT